MIFYRGPALIGHDGFKHVFPSGISTLMQPGPVGRFASAGLVYSELSLWHIGVVCLIGNCFFMAAYLVLQVSHCKSVRFFFAWSFPFVHFIWHIISIAVHKHDSGPPIKYNVKVA